MLMYLVFAVIVILASLALIAAVAKRQPSGRTPDYPYRLAEPFLSKAELSFFGVLRQAVGDRALVLAKVRIADVLTTRRGLSNSQRQIARNKIQSKHFDFVICANDTAQPQVAVELDDSSHARKKQIARDELVNNSAKAAGLPLLRISAQRAYAITDLRQQLAPHLGVEHEPPGDAASNRIQPATEPPSCPKCGSGMLRRHGKTGAMAGKNFWGCQHYPRCRSVVPIDA